MLSDTSTMRRSALAKEFGIRRVHLVPTDEGVFEFGVPDTAFLASSLMEASLKMRCDTSGAGYAIYWKEAEGKLTIAGDYVTPRHMAAVMREGMDQSFAKASYEVTLDAQGVGPVAKCYRTGEAQYVSDVRFISNSDNQFKRKLLASNYGIRSICFVPVEGGVMEYGTSKGPDTANWGSMDDAIRAVMPKAEMRSAFENGATHMIFWAKNDYDEFECRASYVLPERVRALAKVRGDDKTYTTEVRAVRN